MITLPNLPNLATDLLLYIGTYLENDEPEIDNIDEITLAGIVNNVDMLDYLAEKYDEAAFSNSLAWSGNLRMLIWAKTKGCLSCGVKFGPAVLQSGNLQALQWLCRQDHRWTRLRWTRLNICQEVAEYGNLDMLKWFHNQNQGYPLSGLVLHTAAKKGDFLMVQWLRNQGCPWDESTTFVAARRGDLPMLEWLHSQGCPWFHNTCEAAAESGNLILLKWLQNHGCPWEIHQTFRGAARSGNLEMLQWLYSQGCKLYPAISDFAMVAGNLETIQWLHDQGCPRGWRNPAWSGNLEVVKWFHDQGCPLDRVGQEMMNSALFIGNLEVIKWLREQGYAWDVDTCGTAGVLKWLRSQGCPWDESTCSAATNGDGFIRVLRWSIDNGCPEPQDDYYEEKKKRILSSRYKN